jgi:hypothetical protein
VVHRKQIIALLIAFVIFVNVYSSYALQQVAAPLIIYAERGSSGSADYGLVNNGNETITVKLRTDGNAAQYLSFPSSVELPPNKMVFTTLTATIPASYSMSNGGKISGYIYALHEGVPGQVQINIQMKKDVTIVVSDPSGQISSDQSNVSAQLPASSVMKDISPTQTPAESVATPASIAPEAQENIARPAQLSTDSQPSIAVNSPKSAITGFSVANAGIHYLMVITVVCLIGIIFVFRGRR